LKSQRKNTSPRVFQKKPKERKSEIHRISKTRKDPFRGGVGGCHQKNMGALLLFLGALDKKGCASRIARGGRPVGGKQHNSQKGIQKKKNLKNPDLGKSLHRGGTLRAPKKGELSIWYLSKKTGLYGGERSSQMRDKCILQEGPHSHNEPYTTRKRLGGEGSSASLRRENLGKSCELGGNVCTPKRIKLSIKNNCSGYTSGEEDHGGE